MKLLFNRKKRTFIKVLQVTFLLSMLSISSSKLLAQPSIPELSLGVRAGTTSTPYNPNMDNNLSEWYPDNRIWVAPSRVDAQNVIDNEIIIPVLMTNNWATPTGVTAYEIEPLASFTFGFYYDGTILEFLGVHNEHPYSEREAASLGIQSRYNTPPLAEHFILVSQDAQAPDYLKYFNRDLPNSTTGRKVVVTGEASSFRSLPTTGVGNSQVLVYLKFKVKVRTNDPSNVNRRAVLYLDPGCIVYNGINVAKDRILGLFKKFPGDDELANLPINQAWVAYVKQRNDNMVSLDTAWSQAQIESRLSVANMVGVQRYHNFDFGTNANRYSFYRDGNYHLPGAITINVMSSYPEFSFDVVNPSSSLVAAAQIERQANDLSTWVLQDLITTDQPKMFNPNDEVRKGNRLVDVNISANSRMDNVIIETDQDWLRVASINNIDNNIGSKFTGITRRAFVLRLDNTIVDGYNPFPSTETAIQPSRRFRLNIDCDPNGLQPGLYTGYVTFKAQNDRYQPTRIEVKFLVFANPQEVTTLNPNTSDRVYPHGIKLKVAPFNATRPELVKTLIMGSGSRATDGADTLYGEFAEPNPLGTNRSNGRESFDARFFLDTVGGIHPAPNNNPVSDEYRLWKSLVDNGFGDFAQNEGNRRSNSRDIRSLNTNAKSHIYLVKYSYVDTTASEFFPIVLEWDANELMPSSSIFLRYMANGQENVVDMHSAGTPIGGNKFTFTFHDRNVQEFRIEYTVGTENLEDLADNFGEAIIQPDGWNFVSIPLRPANTYYSYIFREALSTPVTFFISGWQPVSGGMLQPGVGYFIKYARDVDKRFSGARFNLISKATYPVRLYEGVLNTLTGRYEGGWNAIGALSTPVSIDNISFEEHNGKRANMQYTMEAQIWAYVMNRGYRSVDMLLPGKGYWLKVDTSCYLHLINPNAKQVIGGVAPALVNKVAGFDKINVVDNAQRSTSIYATNNISVDKFQLPPAPPAGLFDVRFTQGAYVANYDDAVISLSGVTYPVALNFENPRANYTVVDAENGYVFGTAKAGNSQNVIVNGTKSNTLKLLVEAAAETFFVTIADNPVTANVAKVSFGIYADANVTLAIYNTLGNEMAKLEAGHLAKGVHNHEINISNLTSGSYIVRLTAGNEHRTFRMNVVR